MPGGPVDADLGATHLKLSVLEHVIDCLGSSRSRGTQRVSVRQSLEPVVGFRPSHFRLTGGRTPEQLVHGDIPLTEPGQGSTPFLDEKRG
ncbi:MAG: hypothetical protein RLP45_16480 [Haliea sp.]